MRLLVAVPWFSSLGLFAGCGERDSMAPAVTGGSANVAANSSTAGTGGDSGGDAGVGGAATAAVGV